MFASASCNDCIERDRDDEVDKRVTESESKKSKKDKKEKKEKKESKKEEKKRKKVFVLRHVDLAYLE